MLNTSAGVPSQGQEDLTEERFSEKSAELGARPDFSKACCALQPPTLKSSRTETGRGREGSGVEGGDWEKVQQRNRSSEAWVLEAAQLVCLPLKPRDLFDP